jgi:hypothetical protein
MDRTRRSVLLGAGGALGGAAALATPAPLGAAQDETRLLSTYVAGTAYFEGREVAPLLRPGDVLALHREPRNDYDPRAVAVRTRSGAKLGYVPRVHNHALANLMDAGVEVTGRVREVVPDGRQPDVHLDVFLTV